MSLRIRLSRVGSKKQASYRIVVAEASAPRDGKAIDILGHYNPLTDPYTLKVDEERAVRWLKSGAQPSDTARGLLTKAGVMTAYESARTTPTTKRTKAKGTAAEETKAKRAARSASGGPKRTEPPRLARPLKTGEVAAAAAKPVRAAAKKAAPAKPARAKAPAAAKPAASKSAKPAAAKKPATTRTTRSKAAAAKAKAS